MKKTNYIARFFVGVVVGMLLNINMYAQKVITLEGAWDFVTQPEVKPTTVAVTGGATTGGATAMPLPPATYTDYVMLPGSMLTNGKGDVVTTATPWTGSLYDSSYYFNPYMARYRQTPTAGRGRTADGEEGVSTADGKDGVMKLPFFLTPERHYVGMAWYRRQIYVPKEWKDQRVTLFLERPHIETFVYVNGKAIGHQMALSVPHRYDITDAVKTGGKNEVVIGVYNGIENVCVGQDSHSVTDQTQGNWNGIAGRIELQSQWKRLYVKHVAVRLDSAFTGVVKGRGRHKVREKAPAAIVTVTLADKTAHLLALWDYCVNVSLSSMADGRGLSQIRREQKLVKEAKDGKLEFTFFCKDDLRLWDEFTPHLYMLTVEAGDDYYETPVGLRRLDVEGRQLMINGRPLFLRGTVENCCFPETGFPPMDEDEWQRVFLKCKEYGLNHVRFHSYCPPEAAFAAADRVGMYLQVEGPSWPNHGVRLRRGMAIDRYLLDESRRIIDEYGHHPSFVMMAAGNEPSGDWVPYCNDWVKAMKAYDPTKLYCGASVGGGWAWDSGSEYHVKGGARGLDWDDRAPGSADDYFSQIEFPRNYKDTAANQTPIVAHEQGQWCAFPDLKETSQYTGVYKAYNFDIFADLLRDGGMATQAEKFLKASGRLQTLCYKYEIERNLRTPDYSGFQLLGLNDYSGQGTALVGALNVHWREKGYTNAREWTEFCSMLVPLARFPRFVYSNRDTLRVPVECYNAYCTELTGSRPVYYVADDSARVYGGGRLSTADLPIGKNIQLGEVVLPLDSVKAPAKLTLTVQFNSRIKNHWEFWVYPEESRNEERGTRNEEGVTRKEERGARNEERGTIDVTSDYQEALAMLAEGRTVLLEAAGQVTLGSDVRQTYLPVFWNTSWFKMRPPHTTGAYIQKEHPLFRYGFPTDDWSNLNWWELLNKAQVMNLRELPADYQPPIQPIDTWHVSRKLAMLVEARVGQGRLLVTTMDISRDLDRRLVARQMRHAILAYMQSADFKPTLQLSPDQLTHFFTLQAPPVNMFTNDSPDELKPKIN